ncbi:GNAT family N-acetyltransferase [Glaciimonas soli]|uniref:GNAT family N-acetyltransferase n=1 Tax=Glaciimonas soli TaxID=2590999 RepID=UPI001885212D|nr:GNAT family N-acetyltransferase [Glaciimonas soli]
MANVIVRRAELSEKVAIRNLLELYTHDLSEFWPNEVDEHGLFGYPTLDYYWREPDHTPFIFTVDDNYVGFALVNNDVCLPENKLWMAQFFVMRRYRGRGIAREAAIAIFDEMPGKWEVGQIPLNKPAQIFWRKTILAYTKNKFNETYLENDAWHGTLQWFDNSRPPLEVS